MPKDASGQDDVLRGPHPLRMPATRPDKSIAMFVAGDQLLKGAALNAVQIAEVLVERGLGTRRMIVDEVWRHLGRIGRGNPSRCGHRAKPDWIVGLSSSCLGDGQDDQQATGDCGVPLSRVNCRMR